MSQKKISRGVVHVHAERAPQSVVGKGPETVWNKMLQWAACSATLTLPDYGRVARRSGITCPAATSETRRIQGTLETEAAYLVDERVGAQCLITVGWPVLW